MTRQEGAQACDEREDGVLGRKLDILDRADGVALKTLRRRLAPLSRRIASLRTRPGFRRKRK